MVFKTAGDAFCTVFLTVSEALTAAAAAQCALQDEAWSIIPPIRVRMAVHAGTAELRGNDYFGGALNRVARLISIGHGGQTLVSAAAYELVRDVLPSKIALRAMGEHRLRDLSRPETVFALLHQDLPAEFPPLRSLDNPELPNNLPQQVTSFIGREREVAALKTLLQSSRLVTLTGSGGSGKSRLSLQVAADLLDSFPDGAWLVELAPLADPALIPQTVAGALGVREEPARTVTQTLVDYLKPKSLLLILDNCEHVLDDAANLCDAILRSCPNICIIASSREALGIGGESTFPVPSLSLPDAERLQTPQSLSQFEAVRLFIERATAVVPDFAVTSQNAPALASVCHRLDGIPLAIELAAARVRSMTVEELETRLSNRFRLLTGGSRTALPRQQTLRALIDWSYDLLDEKQKALLCALSVFAGGWTLAAAEAVCASPDSLDDWEVLDVLTALSDKSLVVAEAREGATRYRLLETVRQYGRDRLAENRTAGPVRTRHRHYFLALAEEANPNLRGPAQKRWMDILECEHDNLRAALEWCQEDDTLENEGASVSPSEMGLRLANALWPFWQTRGHLSEGRQRCAAALSRPGAQDRTKVRAAVLRAAGGLAERQCDYAQARSLFEDSLSLYRELGNKAGMANSLMSLGNVAINHGEFASARSLYEQSLSIQREIGNKTGIAPSLMNLGNVALAQGNYSVARLHYEECLPVYKELGNKGGMANCLINQGNMFNEQGDDVSARSLYEEGLLLYRELGNRQGIAAALVNLGPLACRNGDFAESRSCLIECLTLGRTLGDKRLIAYALEGFAALAQAQEQLERATRLYGVSAALREAIGTPLLDRKKEEVNDSLAALRTALGEAGFDAAYSAGRVMNGEQSIEYALEGVATSGTAH